MSAQHADPLDDLVGVGADLEPGTILAAYRNGLFPMGVGVDGTEPLGWWSPDPRGILLPGDFHASRSLRRSRRQFQIRYDTAFDEVVAGCASPERTGRWITPQFQQAYRRLHDLGWAHSVEVWREGDLVGGLYGLAIGRLFAAESKFHQVSDASKTAVAALTELMDEDGQPWVIDVQWRTEHLASLGVREVRRSTYLPIVRSAVLGGLPPRWG